MIKPHPLLFSLQKMVVDLALIDRNHYLASTERRENDIEHSLSVAVLCWFIHDKYDIDLDIGKILKYAIAHDFVELYAGDINAFADKAARKNKVELEKDSLKKMSSEFKDFPDMIEIMEAYENKADEEALFVWTVDKMQALIMGDLDKWRPYEEYGIHYDWFVEKYTEQLGRSSKHCKTIFEGLLEYCKSTYYDRLEK